MKRRRFLVWLAGASLPLPARQARDVFVLEVEGLT
jgi:hypothetical protein